MKRSFFGCVILASLLVIQVPLFAQDEERADISEETEEPGIDPSSTDRRQSTGAGFALGLGPFATYRRMTLSGSLRDIKHQPGIYIGGILDLDFSLASLGDFGNLSFYGRGGFASTKSTDKDNAIGRQLVTENTFVNAYLILKRRLSDPLDIHFLVGGGATSFTVEPNARYTGHQYITADFGFVIAYWFNPKGYFSGGLIARPALLTNQSDKADGAGRGFGTAAKVEFGYRLLEPSKGDLANAVEMLLSYDFNYFHSSFPLSGRVGADPTATDLSHMAGLSLRYNL